MNRQRLKIILSYFLVSCAVQMYAQQPGIDTVGRKQIVILHADKIGFKQTDTLNRYQLLVGNVAVQQENTLFYCDSAALNTTLNILESFGHVHINDNDSLQIYSDYLKYLGHEKKATLTGNVRLTDGRGILTTKQLDYDLSTKIGIYTNGGKVVNDSTILTSSEGYYYEDTRDVIFKKNVVLVNPEYTIKTDTLLYNTYSGVATFIVPTEITSDSSRQKIYTTDGYYDTKGKKAYFGKRPKIWDRNTYIEADEIANDSTGFGEARGNVIYKDTAQKVTIIANHMNTNRKENSFFATEKPVMIIKQDQDSIFVAADTLYSARLSDLRKHRYVPVIVEKVKVNSPLDRDSIHQAITVDTATNAENDTETVEVKTDTVTSKSNALPLKDTLVVKDTTESRAVDSTDRFIEAYYHVRIYSDSLQAVGDSLFYSSEDSVFRLFDNPVVWTRDNQVTGDTIYLFTENKKPKRMYVFENAMAISKVDSTGNFFNQVKGRTINGYFKEGNIEFMRAKGNAESVYYAQDETNKFIGVNKATADIIDMYFDEKKPQRVVFRNNLVGTSYPMRQVNHEELKLRGFKWLDQLRPKSEYELFTEPTSIMIDKTGQNGPKKPGK